MTTEQYAIGFSEGYEQGQADALDAPDKPVDCRRCKNFITRSEICSLSLAPVTKPKFCINFNKYTALPPIVLTEVTKVTK